MWSVIFVICLVGFAALITAPSPKRHSDTEAASDEGEKGHEVALEPALLADLLRVGLESGVSLPAAIEALAIATSTNAWAAVFARALVIGVPWTVALTEVPARYRPLLEAIEPAWRAGVAPEPLLLEYARKYRREVSAQGREAAAALTSKLVVPVSLCLLPAFIVLGIVPAIFGGVTSLWG